MTPDESQPVHSANTSYVRRGCHTCHEETGMSEWGVKVRVGTLHQRCQVKGNKRK
jgi:hypothetical protein